MKIPFSRVNCSGNELAYIGEVLKSGWLTTAAKCAEFEKRVAEMVGAHFACAVNSATAALHLAAEAIGIRPGDKVLVPTMTFTASAEIVRYLGADPVFLDVEYGTCLVSPAILTEAVSRLKDVKALILVHFGGQAADMNQILPICRARGIRVIEDAAHAFPTRYGNKMIGAFGDVTCFSFYANKTITTGEGGMLLTNDKEIYNRARIMRLHGINRDIWNRYTAARTDWEYDVVAPGFKYNMPDIAAAIGLAQLERIDEFRLKRQKCVEYYYSELSDISCIDLPIIRGDYSEHAWHLFWIVLNDKSPIERNELIRRLNEAGIGTSVHYKPLHRMSYYKDRYCLNPDGFPNAERHWRGTVTLPVYPDLQKDELRYICSVVRKSLGS